METSQQSVWNDFRITWKERQTNGGSLFEKTELETVKEGV